MPDDNHMRERGEEVGVPEDGLAAGVLCRALVGAAEDGNAAAWDETLNELLALGGPAVIYGVLYDRCRDLLGQLVVEESERSPQIRWGTPGTVPGDAAAADSIAHVCQALLNDVPAKDLYEAGVPIDVPADAMALCSVAVSLKRALER